MFRAILSFFGAIFSWISLGAVLAVVVVGGILWMYSRDLPNHEQLARYEPPTISRIYSGEGRLIDEFAQERRLFVAIDDIPDLVKHAFISAEDKNFYLHSGYDARSMVAALIDAVRTRGETLRGASTITQQVMKNFLLSGDRTGERKIKEIILATRLEETLEKDQILELYLNEIFLGQNSYGVAAAAQTYFNKTLEELEIHEAAFLAALPQAPSNYHPVRARERVTARRNWVLGQMFENGYIDAATLAHERAQPLRTVQSGDFEPFRASLPPRDYFTDEIRRQLSGSFGEDEFFGGGLTIRATMEPVLQRAAADALREGLESYDRAQAVWRGTEVRLEPGQLGDEEVWRAALSRADMPRDIDGWRVAVVLGFAGDDALIGVEGVPAAEGGHRIPASDITWARPLNEAGRPGQRARRASDLLAEGDVIHVMAVRSDSGTLRHWSLRQVPEIQGAFMAMDVNTGRVLAMQGGFSYQHSVFNRTTQAMRQPGSAFKPLVFAAALDSGYTPGTIVLDAPVEIEAGDGSVWRPRNASNRFYGPTPLRTGIEWSRNLMTIRLAQDVGMDTVARYAERFGVYDRMEPFLANALGSQETTLFRMVAAYAMFANGGERVEPTLVDRVQDRHGRTIFRHDRRECPTCAADYLPEGARPQIISNRARIMDPFTAYQLTSMMKGVVDRGTASRTVRVGVPIAGKTGTTNDARDVWFVGFSSNIVAGCYMGFDRPEPLGRGASGGGMCGPVFNSFMRKAVQIYGGTDFAVPPGGTFVNIDRYTGERLPDGERGAHVVAEYFRHGEEPVYGIYYVIDGGFAMGSDLPLFERGTEPGAALAFDEAPAARDDASGREVITGSGERRVIPAQTSFGSVSSGGLY